MFTSKSFIRSEFVVVLLATTLCQGTLASATTIFSDSFSGSTLNSAWTVVSPNPASSVGLTGDALNITASPLNGGCDLWPSTNYNAPRILYNVGASTDWILETEMQFSPQSINNQGAGLLLAMNTSPNWNSSTPFDRVCERAYAPSVGSDPQDIFFNEANGTNPAPTSYVNTTLTTTYFRLEKLGSTYTNWWSADGSNWNTGCSFTPSAPFPYVGLFALRQPWDGDLGVVSSANFDYFTITTVPEPTSLTLLVSALLGLAGAFHLRRRRAKV